MRPFVILLAAFALSACATAGEKQYRKLTHTLDRAAGDFAECRRGLAAKPYMKVLSGRIWLDGDRREPPPSFFTSEEKASEAHVAAIDRLAQDSLTCAKAFRDALRPAYPVLAAVIDKDIAATRGLYVELVEGKISFAGFYKRSKEQSQATVEAWRKSYRTVIARLNEIHKNELLGRGVPYSYVKNESVEPEKVGSPEPKELSPYEKEKLAINQCFGAIGSKPYGALLSGRIWYSPQGQTAPLSYFTNQERASGDLVPALEAFAQDLMNCHQRRYDLLGRNLFYGAAARSIGARYLSGMRALFIDLIGGQITFGDFHKRQADLNDEVQYAWEQQSRAGARAMRESFARSEARRNAEDARRAAREAEAARAAAQSRSPSTTNCYVTPILGHLVCTTK